MCSFDQSWDQVFLQIAVSVLIFGIGIPSLAIQAIVQEDVRRIVYRHRQWLRWRYIPIGVFMTIALAFIWFTPPCGSGQTSLLAKIGLNTKLEEWVPGVLITTAIVGLGVGLYVQFMYRKERILNQLKGKCIRSIHRFGVVDGDALKDIRYLGEKEETESERIEVIKILEMLAIKIQEYEQYKGNQLEDVIEAIELILQKEPGVHSFNQGIQALTHIIEKAHQIGVESEADTGVVLRSLQRLGELSFAMRNGRPPHKILDAIELVSRGTNGILSKATLALQELGALALKHERYLVAVEALNKLEAITWPKQPLDAAKSNAYLGLLAHFWSTSSSARDRAVSSLDNVEFTPSLLICLLETKAKFFNEARFDTADQLSEMITNF